MLEALAGVINAFRFTGHLWGSPPATDEFVSTERAVEQIVEFAGDFMHTWRHFNAWVMIYCCDVAWSTNRFINNSVIEKKKVSLWSNR